MLIALKLVEAGAGRSQQHHVAGACRGDCAGARARVLRPHSNAVLALEQLGADVPLVVSSKSPLAPTWDLPILQPGELGFALRRSNPTDKLKASGDKPDKKLLAESMFNILLPTLKSIGNALPGYEAPPLSPAAEGEDWSYACKISLSDIKKDTALDERLRMGDIPEETSPYRWIASDAVAEFKFDSLDGFGDLWPYPPGDTVKVPWRYTDDLLGPNRWPGLDMRYSIEAGVDGKAKLVADCRFDPKAVTNPKAVEEAATIWKTVAYQLMDPDVSISLRTSVGADRLGKQAETTLDRAKFLEYAKRVYGYLCAVSLRRDVEVFPTKQITTGARTEMWKLSECAFVAETTPVILRLPAAVRFLSDQLNKPIKQVLSGRAFSQSDLTPKLNIPKYYEDPGRDGEVGFVDGTTTWAYLLHVPLKPGTQFVVSIPPKLLVRPITLRKLAAAARMPLLAFVKSQQRLGVKISRRITLNNVTVESYGARHVTEMVGLFYSINDTLARREEGLQALVEMLADDPDAVTVEPDGKINMTISVQPGETSASILRDIGYDPFAPDQEYFVDNA